jgi:DNA-binding NarL/FixJ family response regulator
MALKTQRFGSTLYSLVDSQGRPFPGHIQSSLSQAITTAISDPEVDIDLILRTAQGIGERAPQKNIVDLVRYATKALFNVSRRSRLKRIATEKAGSSELSETLVCHDHKSIEARVLVSEILQSLPTTERNVLLRFTYGLQHREIARELGISVHMSRHHLSSARKHLAGLLGKAQ